MKHYLVILSGLVIPSLVIASPESENEPARTQMDILVSALSTIQKSGVEQLTTKYNKIEKTGYYVRNSSFIGRFHTPSGFRNIIKFKFIRSSKYDSEDNSMPPRGHSFVVIFDDSIDYLSHRRIEHDSMLQVEGATLIIDQSINVDLAVLKGKSTKTIQENKLK